MQSVCGYISGRVGSPLIINVKDVQGVKRAGQVVEAINTDKPLIAFENAPETVSTYSGTGSKIITHSLRIVLLGFDASNNYLQFVGNRYLVIFESDGAYYTFGEDAGASFSLEADATGTALVFTAQSRFSLFPLSQVGRNWVETLAIKTAFNCILGT